MKKVALALLSFGCLSASADWVEHQLLFEVASKEAMEITEGLVNFPAVLNWMNAHGLTASSRLRVVRLDGRLAVYRWENDESCTVAEPTKVPHVTLYHAETDYIYEGNPAQIWQLQTAMWTTDPCVGPPQAPRAAFHHSRK